MFVDERGRSSATLSRCLLPLIREYRRFKRGAEGATSDRLILPPSSLNASAQRREAL